MEIRGPHVRWLAVAFTAVVLCFVGATAYSQLRESEVSVLSDSLANNAMPSIRHLALARSELHHVKALVDKYITDDDGAREETLSSLLEATNQIDWEMEAYLSLASYPGESELFREIRARVSAIEQAIAATRASVEGRDLERAQASAARLGEECDSALTVMLQDIDLNAKQGQQIAERIGADRRRSLLVALVLDFISAALTVIVALLAMRAFGRHADLLRRHNMLLTQRADELEQFAGRVAHDIRNPIAAAVMSLDAVKRVSGGNKKIDDRVERGVSNLRRASLLLDGLLAFARAGAHPAPGASSDVRGVIESSLEELQAVALAARVELHSEPIPECKASCDPSILELLISNLVQNAIKYMGDGPERRVTLRACEVDAFVRVEVEDTGIGVPSELRTAIFEPFFRGSVVGSGVGLGLATVKKICDTHGGRVGFDPISPRGSLFWFELPKPSGEPIAERVSRHVTA